MNLSEKIAQLKGKDSYRDMSEKTGISHNYLRYLIKGIDPRSGKPIEPSADILRRLANAYSSKTSYSELMELAGYITSDELDNIHVDGEKGKGDFSDADLDKMLDNAMSFDGKPITDHDREIIRAYLKGKYSK
ncbi:helix-turn-helix transcriptional regulator [Enterococcus hirae]|nr:helix-turn-helix transcriptional regulator [Enterococcus hirae]